MTEGPAFPMSAPQVRPGAARVQSVERAAALLRAVAAATGADGTATALGESVGLNRTTSWRLLATLEQQQLVTPRRGQRDLHPGPGLLDLADQAAGTALAQPGQRTCCATSPPGPGRPPPWPWSAAARSPTWPRHLPAPWSPRAGSGRRSPCTAPRRARCCSPSPPPRTAAPCSGRHRDGRLPRHTPTTITSLGALEEELALTRARGYAVCRGEFESSAWGVSAPVLDLAGRPVAVVSLWGPSERLTADRFEALGRLAVLGAAEVARRRTGEHHEATGPAGDRLAGSHERRRPCPVTDQ